MLTKLSTLVFLLPFVSALTINTPTGLTAGGTATISWSALTTDASAFSIELVNVAFNKEYAVATNVLTINGKITFELPQLEAGGGYSINFVAIDDINTVYASTGPFTILPASSSSTTAASTDSTPATTASSATTSESLSTPATSFTTPATASTVNTGSTTGTASAATSTPSKFSTGGAASFKLAGVAPAAALVLSAVAGAVMVF